MTASSAPPAALGDDRGTDLAGSELAQGIVVRHPVFGLDETLPRHWFDGRPFATHVFDGLSSTFPEGEAFFVRSVMHYRNEICDPRLRAEVQAFAAQEGQHSRQHDEHLEILYERYPGLRKRNALMGRVMHWSNRVQPKTSLAATAAVEHLTALLARKLLGDPERWLDTPMEGRMARLWKWHALEESEHKAVAFDVFRLISPKPQRERALRSWMLAINTLGLFVETLDRALYMCWKDGVLWKRETWRDARRFVFGADGILAGTGPDYRAFYALRFHPDQADDRELVARTRAELDQAA